MKKWREKMKKVYEEIVELAPPYEAIHAWAGDVAVYGVVTFTERSNNPLHIHLHDTWCVKYGGKLHIDVVSGDFHLMLDKNNAPLFLEFVKDWLEKQKTPPCKNQSFSMKVKTMTNKEVVF